MKSAILTIAFLLVMLTALVGIAQQPYNGGREYVVRYTYDGSGNVAT